MKFRGMAAALALALGTMVGGGMAHAAVYYFTVDGCGGAGCLPSSNSSVTVTDTGGSLNFTVSLADGLLFNANGGNHHSFVFNLSNTGLAGLGITNLSSGFTALALPGAYNEPPPGSTVWDAGIQYTGGAAQGSTPSTVSFKVTDFANDLTLSMLTSPGLGGNPGVPALFGADVYGKGLTGDVFVPTGPGGGVPEPATWGMMIMGVFAMGAAMRQRRAMITA